MYYNNGQEQDLGFDAFIAPDDFNRTAQPVDIYEVFKREYALNSQARYIYYYSDGNYPLTLTPTADEYYKYGYTQGGIDVVVDLALNAAPVTIFGETLTTKRWVIVYRPSTAKFSLAITVSRAEWIYCSTTIFEIKRSVGIMSLKYIHISNLNSLTGNFAGAFNVLYQTPGIGSINIPESISEIGLAAFPWIGTNKVNLPRTKNITQKIGTPGNAFPTQGTTIYNFGASTSLGSESERSQYIYLKEISVSPQNTGFASFDNCDIIYTKDLTTLVWLAPKTVRGLTLPDQLPQAQITALGTKLNANIMQGFPLYIGTQITDLTNLYLSNKSFSTIGVGVGNTMFSAENGMLRTATNLIKAGTSNTGDLIIPNVQTIEADCFLRCTGYTGNLTIPNTVTSIAAGVFLGLTNLTSLTLPVGYDCTIYSNFTFANFSATSLNTAIQNLANGTVGAPKYFAISKTSLDALNVAYPNAVSNATARYINVYANAIQDSSLKLWLDAGNTLSYPGSGTAWNDLSGNGNNGTLVNGVAFSGANGGVMSFDGVNDYIKDIPPAFNLQNTVPYSLSIAFNSSNISANQQLIGNWDTLVSNGWRLDISGSKLRFLATSANGNTGFFVIQNNPLSSNTWYVLNVVYQGGNNPNGFLFYLNGSIIPTSITGSTSVLLSNNKITIGSSQINTTGYSNFFKGALNDTLIYNRALTQAEITQNFEATRSKYGI